MDGLQIISCEFSKGHIFWLQCTLLRGQGKKHIINLENILLQNSRFFDNSNFINTLGTSEMALFSLSLNSVNLNDVKLMNSTFFNTQQLCEGRFTKIQANLVTLSESTLIYINLLYLEEFSYSDSKLINAVTLISNS